MIELDVTLDTELNKMKNIIALLALFFGCHAAFCMHDSHSVLSPSIVGEVYTKLSNANLVGRILADQDIQKAKKMVNIEQLKHWDTKIKPFEVDLLFQLGFVLYEIGNVDLAADMILYYSKGNKNNFVIETTGNKTVDKERIMKVLEAIDL